MQRRNFIYAVFGSMKGGGSFNEAEVEIYFFFTIIILKDTLNKKIFTSKFKRIFSPSE